MEQEQIIKLIQTFDASSLTELDYSNGEIQLHLGKNTPAVTPVVAAAPDSTVTPVEPVVSGAVISAPLVGIIYLAPGPDQPNFKQVGDYVEVGDVVCIIESMKMMNEIKSEVSGTLTQVLVDNEAVVEFEQPLFAIKA